MDEYKIFRGYSKDEANLLWTAKEPSSIFQVCGILDVFVASNESKKSRDFKIKQKFFSESYCFYRGNVMVAKVLFLNYHPIHIPFFCLQKQHINEYMLKMKETNKLQNCMKMKDTYRLEIFRNIDHSFIVSLVVVLNMLEETKRSRHGIYSQAALFAIEFCLMLI